MKEVVRVVLHDAACREGLHNELYCQRREPLPSWSQQRRQWRAHSWRAHSWPVRCMGDTTPAKTFTAKGSTWFAS
ncbi:hypothetical protein HaLaN_08484, partial [Haematococcus lacustris]